jgi:hypothetical protein
MHDASMFFSDFRCVLATTFFDVRCLAVRPLVSFAKNFSTFAAQASHNNQAHVHTQTEACAPAASSLSWGAMFCKSHKRIQTKPTLIQE